MAEVKRTENSAAHWALGELDGVEVSADSLALSLPANLDGKRISPPLDVTAAGTYANSRVTWSATTPTNTSLAIHGFVTGETAIVAEAVGTGDGVATAFTLDNYPVVRLDDLVVKIDGTATTAYTRVGRSLTFDAAPGDTLAITADYTGVDWPINEQVEVQTLDLDAPTGGTFKLGDGTTWTADLAHDAAPATVEAALEGLYGAGNVGVIGLRPWTPTEITTALWLDADDSSTITLDVSDNVEQWDDKSGNARHAAQSTPADRPGYTDNEVVFPSRGPFLNGSWPITLTAQTVFAVFHYTSGCDPWARVFTQSDAGTDYQTSGHYIPFMRDSSTTTFGSFHVGAYRSIFTVAYDADTMVCSAHSGSQLINYLNDVAATAYSGTLDKTFTRYGIGYDFVPQRLLVGGVREIIVLPALASTDDRQKVFGYLAHKWGLTASLPSSPDHPYKTTAPTAGTAGLFTVTFPLSIGDSGLVADFTGLTYV